VCAVAGRALDRAADFGVSPRPPILASAQLAVRRSAPSRTPTRWWARCRMRTASRPRRRHPVAPRWPAWWRPRC